MRGLSIPEDFPLEELVTQELISVSIGRHHLRLAFAREEGATGFKRIRQYPSRPA